MSTPNDNGVRLSDEIERAIHRDWKCKDESMTARDLVLAVKKLHPGADTMALVCLANLACKPPAALANASKTPRAVGDQHSTDAATTGAVKCDDGGSGVGPSRPAAAPTDLAERLESLRSALEDWREAFAMPDETNAAAILRVSTELLDGDDAKQRARKAAQAIIAEIGSVGPENVDDAAARIVAALRARVASSSGVAEERLRLAAQRLLVAMDRNVDPFETGDAMVALRQALADQPPRAKENQP